MPSHVMTPLRSGVVVSLNRIEMGRSCYVGVLLLEREAAGVAIDTNIMAVVDIATEADRKSVV